jgi:hypothetical protein
VEEPTLAHLTPLGHELMGARYSEKIKEIFQEQSKSRSITAIYKAYPRNEMIFGLGDYLYGIMHLYQITNRNLQHLTLRVNYSESPIAPFLKEHVTGQAIEPKYFFHDADDDDILKSGAVFTNKRPKEPISVACRDFVLRNALPFNESIIQKAETSMGELGIKKKQYSVIHVRIGDSEMLEKTSQGAKELLDAILLQIVKLVNNFEPDRDYVVISDSESLKMSLKHIGIVVVEGSPGHTGFSSNNFSSMETTLIEFLILMNSEKIIQLSNHSWGSGFSETAAILGNVPIDKIALS